MGDAHSTKDLTERHTIRLRAKKKERNKISVSQLVEHDITFDFVQTNTQKCKKKKTRKMRHTRRRERCCGSATNTKKR